MRSCCVFEEENIDTYEASAGEGFDAGDLAREGGRENEEKVAFLEAFEFWDG